MISVSVQGLDRALSHHFYYKVSVLMAGIWVFKLLSNPKHSVRRSQQLPTLRGCFSLGEDGTRTCGKQGVGR